MNKDYIENKINLIDELINNNQKLFDYFRIYNSKNKKFNRFKSKYN